MKKISGEKRLCEASDGGRITQLVNVRATFTMPRAAVKGERIDVQPKIDGRHGVWHPVGYPAMWRIDGWRPIALIDAPITGGRLRLWRNGNRLATSVESYDQTFTPQEVINSTIKAMSTTIDGDPVEFELIGRNILRFTLRQGGARYLHLNAAGVLTYLGEMPSIPEMGFEVTGETNLSEELPVIKLSGQSVGATLRLRGNDSATVAKVLVEAYNRLLERARQGGYAVQPVLARYRLEDAAGNTILTSVPVLVQSSVGFNCCHDISMTTSDNYSTLSGGAITARPYHIKLIHAERTFAEPWRSVIAKVVVEISPGIDPVVADMACDVALSTDSGAQVASTRLPGYTGTGGTHPAQRSELIRRMAADATKFRVYATYNLPFSDEFSDKELPLSAQAEATPVGRHLWHRDEEDYSLKTVIDTLEFRANKRTSAHQGWNIDSLFDSSAPTREPGHDTIVSAGVLDIYDSNGHLIDSRRIMSGTIHAVAEAPRSDSGWDYSRRRMIVAGIDGLKLLTLKNDETIHSVLTLDSRPVESASALISASGAYGQRLLAIAGGDLIEITRSRITTLLADCRAKRLGWNSHYREIWLSGGTGKLRRILASGEVVDVAMQHFSPEAQFFDFEGEHLAIVGSRIFALSHEEAIAMPIVMKLSYTLKPDERLHAVVAEVAASSVSGTFTVGGSNGSGIDDTLLTVNLNGELRAPLMIRVPAPRRRCINTTLSATLSSDASLATTKLLCYK